MSVHECTVMQLASSENTKCSTCKCTATGHIQKWSIKWRVPSSDMLYTCQIVVKALAFCCLNSSIMGFSQNMHHERNGCFPEMQMALRWVCNFFWQSNNMCMHAWEATHIFYNNKISSCYSRIWPTRKWGKKMRLNKWNYVAGHDHIAAQKFTCHFPHTLRMPQLFKKIVWWKC